jgi:hypothetical protein
MVTGKGRGVNYANDGAAYIVTYEHWTGEVFATII